MSVILLPDFIIPKVVAHTFDNLERIVTRDEPTWLIGPAAAEMLIFWFN
ncbi:hypothetical protein [Fastidiosibacter lacustris]|nr:hypothetical protein [Fastidiosibacter lacustris]